MELTTLLAELVERGGTDLHLVAGTAPTFRVAGALVQADGAAPLEATEIASLLAPHLTDEQKAGLEERRDVNVSVREAFGAFRGRVFRERGHVGAALRAIPRRVPTLEDLGTPPVLERLTQAKRGLILLTGPTGSGKSTTCAAMIEEINRTRAERIITIEDPVEYEFTSRRSLITQRAVGQDVESIEQGVLSALQSDLDVALVGELRSLEAVRLALALAETGHLVFSVLHAETASEAVQRLVEVFPEPRETIRRLLARNLWAVVAQMLLPVTPEERERTGRGRAAADEILIATPRVRQMVAEGQPDLTVAIEAGRAQGMQTMDDALVALYEAGVISRETAWDRICDRERIPA